MTDRRKIKVKSKKKSGNFFTRLSGFKKFLCIYSGVLMVIVAVVLIMLYSLLKDYEAGRPANTMDTIVEKIQQGKISSLLEKSGAVSEFENVDEVSEYISSMLAEKEITYRKKPGEYTENTPVYTLYADDEKIASVTLVEKKKNAHNFTEWKLGSIDFNNYSQSAMTVEVPKGAELKINGVTVSSDYMTDEKDVELCKHVSDFVTTPVNSVYTIKGIVKQPEITASMNGKALKVESNKKGYVAYYPEDSQLLESQRNRILTIAENYGKYMINRGSLTTLSSYMVGNAKEYMSDIPAIDVYLIGRTFKYSINNENISNFRKYSEDCFSCDIDYELYVDWSSGNTTYNIALTYTFIKQNDEWLLADFSIR
ncbi:MAG: hypothetical protein ACI4D4_08405 [Lachnospira sp.]